jgi:hypothetical protein
MLTSWLHTDNLRKLFGDIHTEVLVHDRFLRIRAIKTLDAGGKCRMLALTKLNLAAWDEEVLAADEKIRDGGFIGETFKNRGFKCSRKIMASVTWEIPKETQNILGTDSPLVLVWFVRFTIQKPGKTPVVYGDIFEIFPPDYMPPGPRPGVYWLANEMRRELERETPTKQLEDLTGTLGWIGRRLSAAV